MNCCRHTAAINHSGNEQHDIMCTLYHTKSNWITFGKSYLKSALYLHASWLDCLPVVSSSEEKSEYDTMRCEVERAIKKSLSRILIVLHIYQVDIIAHLSIICDRILDYYYAHVIIKLVQLIMMTCFTMCSWWFCVMFLFLIVSCPLGKELLLREWPRAFVSCVEG